MSTQALQRVNVFALEVKHFPDLPAGFRPDIARVGKLLGATRTGMSGYGLPPGEAIGPLSLRGPRRGGVAARGRRSADGAPSRWRGHARALGIVYFPTGPDGAHTVRNDTGATARVLMFSSMTAVAAVVYPDSDKISIWTTNGADDIVVRRASGVDYWEGESPRQT
jgi:hypothetical protein